MESVVAPSPAKIVQLSCVGDTSIAADCAWPKAQAVARIPKTAKNSTSFQSLPIKYGYTAIREQGNGFLPVELRGWPFPGKSARPCYTYAVDRTRRYVECLTFVCIWMTIGWAFNLNFDWYLLVGVPLVILFQKFIRKRPLAQLWARRTRRFRLSWRPVIVALMLFPGMLLVQQSAHHMPISNCLWLLCSVFGAIGVGFALGRQRRWRSKRAWRSAAMAAIIGMVVVGYEAAQTGRSRMVTEGHIATFLGQLVLYVPLYFVVEEVVFRGALDMHLYNRRSRKSHYWASAIFISVLWGLWHLPIIAVGANYVQSTGSLILFYGAVGVPLAVSWRKSGTLLFPAIAHAMIEAYRNSIFLPPPMH